MKKNTINYYLLLLVSISVSNITFSQSYLIKHVNDSSFIVEDTIQIKKIVNTAYRFYKFRSKKCSNTIKFMELYSKSKDTNIYKGFICDSICAFNIEKKPKQNLKQFDRDVILFEEKILNNKIIKEYLRKNDSIRFNRALNLNTIKGYLNYLNNCDCSDSICALMYIEQAEDSIFSLYTPSLYELEPHYKKINELILFLEDKNNYTNKNYSKAVKYVYQIYTNDGEKSTIINLINNDAFNKCLKRCSNLEKNKMNSLFGKDTLYSEKYKKILNNKITNPDTLDLFIKDNLPKESAYRVMQHEMDKLLYYSFEGYKNCSELIKKYFNKDDSLYDLFPEMKIKLRKTLQLINNAKYIDVVSLLNTKGKAGYGNVEKTIITNSNYIFILRDPKHDGDTRASLSKQFMNSLKSTKAQKYYVIDVSYDEKEMILYEINENRIMKAVSRDKSIFELLNSDSIPDNNLTIVNTTKDTKCDFIDFQGNISGLKEQSFIKQNWPPLSSIDIELNKKYSGKKIDKSYNSRYTERDIFIDGDTLYFSSNGFYGLGGYDIYRCIKKNGIWEEPINIGLGVNTFYNDLSYQKKHNEDVFITNIEKRDTLSIIKRSKKQNYTNKGSVFIEVVTPMGVNSEYYCDVAYEDDDGNTVKKQSLYTHGNNLFFKINSNNKNKNFLKISFGNKDSVGISFYEYPLEPKNFIIEDVHFKNPNIYDSINIEDIKIIKPKLTNTNRRIKSLKLKEGYGVLQTGKNNIEWVLITDNEYIYTLPQNIYIYNDTIEKDKTGDKEKQYNIKVKIPESTQDKNILVSKQDTATPYFIFPKGEHILSEKKQLKKLYNAIDDIFNLLSNHAVNFDDGVVKYKIEVIGYASSEGIPKLNEILSKDRGLTIRSMISTDSKIHNRLNKNFKIKDEGKGATKEFGEELIENRRVIIKIIRL